MVADSAAAAVLQRAISSRQRLRGKKALPALLLLLLLLLLFLLLSLRGLQDCKLPPVQIF